jgi:hypothetical protein
MNEPKLKVTSEKVWATESGRELIRLGEGNDVVVVPSKVNVDELRALAKAAVEAANELQQRIDNGS